jgi:hypothetical protein
MTKVDVLIAQHEIRDAQVRTSHEVTKVDMVYPAQEIKGVFARTALCPKTRLDDTLLGYTAELNIGPVTIELDEMGQLDEIIGAVQRCIEIKFGALTVDLSNPAVAYAFSDQLTDLRNLWHREMSSRSLLFGVR